MMRSLISFRTVSLTLTSAISLASNSSRSRGAEAEQAGNDDIGKLLDTDIVDIDRFVVELAAVGNRVLERADAALQVLEIFVGAQFGIILGHREQIAQAEAQRALGLRRDRRHPACACLGHRERACMTFSRVSCSNFMYCLQVSTSLGISSWRCLSSTSIFDQALETLCLRRTRWL